jgi:hypothetical protein
MQTSESRRRMFQWKEKVYNYIFFHQGCTGQDIYVDLQIPDLDMYAVLHYLVDMDIVGPDPYAPGAPSRHDLWVYRTNRCFDSMEAAATGGI